MKTRNFILLFGLAGMLAAAFLTQGCDKILDEPDKGDTTSYQLGDTLWVHNIPQTEHAIYFTRSFPNSNDVAIGTDGTVYYGASPGYLGSDPEQYRVYAVDHKTGELKWQSDELWPKNNQSALAVGDDGTVYAYAFNALVALNSDNGQTKWVWTVPKTIGEVGTDGQIAALAILSDGDLVVKSDGVAGTAVIFRLNVQGNEIWHTFLNENTEWTDSRIFIGMNDFIYAWWQESPSGKLFLHALNPENGTELGKTALMYNSDNRDSKLMVADNGDVIFFRSLRNNGAPADTLVRMSYDLNSTLWAAAVNYTQAEDYSPVLYNGYVYFEKFASDDVYRVNADNGQVDEVALPHRAVVDGKGVFYGGRLPEHDLRAVKYDGTVLNDNLFPFAYWAIKLGNEKELYVVTDQKIYAFGSESGLSKTGWPCFQHDNRNSYNVNTR